MEQHKLQLINLSNAIIQMIQSARPVPRNEIYFKYNWQKFEYSKTGIDLGQGNGEQFLQPIWIQAIHEFLTALISTPAYNQTLRMFKPVEIGEYVLKHFANRAIEICLTTPSNNVTTRINQLVDNCIHQLQHRTVHIHAAVYLIGVTLESDCIQLTPQISLRRTTLKDIAIPQPMLSIAAVPATPYPTAVLDIKETLREVDLAEFFQKIDHDVDIVKLFGVGSIHIKYKIVSTDSLLPGIFQHTQITSPNFSVGLPALYLDTAKEGKLIAFFSYMRQNMPNLSGMNRQINNLSVSFDRYTDASVDSRTFEKNVMNSIMGLEALYLNDNAELAYKLTMRCSKALSCCGLDPVEVKRVMKTGYSVRSKFAHGDQLSPKELAKYDSQFGSYSTIAFHLNNYLRISICATVILKLKKDSFLESLDNSMLTDSITTELRNQFSFLDQYLVP